jgi:hypothetical protein
MGNQTIIHSEKACDFEKKIELPSQNKKIQIKSYPISAFGIEGDLFVMAVMSNGIEKWDERYWIEREVPLIFPTAPPFKLPESIICVNGILISESIYHMLGCSVRLDIRKSIELPLSRSLDYDFLSKNVPEINKRLEEILLKHFQDFEASSPKETWLYKNSVARYFEYLPTFWLNLPETVRIFEGNNEKLVSLNEIRSSETLSLIVNTGFIENKKSADNFKNDTLSERKVFIRYEDFIKLNENFINSLLRKRKCTGVYKQADGSLIFDFQKTEDKNLFPWAMYYSATAFYADLGDVNIFAIKFEYLNDLVLLNLANPLSKWLFSLKIACEKGEKGLRSEQLSETLKALIEAITYHRLTPEYVQRFSTCLTGWREAEGLPPHLKPAPSLALQLDSIITIRPYDSTQL